MTTKKISSLESNESNFLFPYLTGLLTASLILFLFLLFLGFKIGFLNLYTKVKNEIIPPEHSVVSLPQDILDELIQLKAVISDAGNPTNATKHDTFLVRPDEKLQYVVRPNIKVSVHLLKTTQAINIDPPVLHFNYDENLKYSDQLKKYLKEESRLQYFYSTDSSGNRTTVPTVESDKQILIIGDSVAFGLGVDDENTAASHLQKIIGERYKVINTGVSGYSGQQAFLVAEQWSKKQKFSGLIYIACQNDFMVGEDWSVTAKNILTKINTLSNRFNDNVIVVLTTYMQYCLRDFLLEEAWGEDNPKIEKTHLLRQSLPKIAAELGFEYHDWTKNVGNIMKNEKSMFSRFSLFCDHAHLSPLGNRLMANDLFSIIKNKWLVMAEFPSN